MNGPRPRRLSPLVERIAGEGADAWALHTRAVAARRDGEDVIVLSVGDPDVDTPAPVVDAAVASLRAGDTHYTGITGKPELREAIAARHGEAVGHPVDPDRVVVVAGAQNGLFAASLCLCAPGDEVIVPTPMYVTYEAVVRASGARLVPVPAPAGNGFRPDPADLERAVGPATRALFLANPNNPTGVALTAAEADAIADLARRHDLWLVSDEVYADLVFDRPHEMLAARPGMEPRTLTVSSLSKSHAMPGWRMGWVIAPPDVVPHLENLALCMLYGLPGFCQAAAAQALTGSAAEPARLRALFRARRDRMARALEGIEGLRCRPPEAGMFLLLDVRESGISSAEYALRLYEETGVAVLDAAPFGASAGGFLRLSLGASDAELAEAARRMRAFASRS